MNQIHQQLEMPNLKQQFGTQMYEQQVVQLCKDGERDSLGACLGGEVGPLGAEFLHSRQGLSGWNFEGWKSLQTDPVPLSCSGRGWAPGTEGVCAAFAALQ